MTGRIAARVILFVLAAAALAWFAYDVRAVSLDAQGRSEARLAHGAPQVDRALSLFAQAAHGNADPTPRIDEARFLISLGRFMEWATGGIEGRKKNSATPVAAKPEVA